MKRAIAALALLTALIALDAEDVKVGVRPVPPYVMQDQAGNFSGL